MAAPPPDSIAPAATAPRVRIPLRTKFFYGSGSIAEGTKNVAFHTFLLFYYNQVLGLPGTLSGAAIFLALCVDAVTDPLVGSLSDSTRTRFGRRHPFMYAAALPMAACIYLLFNPPSGLSERGLFAWLTIFAVGVRVSMTLYAIPSNSMVPELTTHYDERTSLVSWRFLFGWLGGLGAVQLGYLVFFAPSAAYGDGRLDPDAYGHFGLACAAIVATAILACAAGTHHVIPRLRRPGAAEPFSRARFAGEVRNALGNRSYRVLLVGAIFASVAGGFSDVVGLYVSTYFWEFTTAQIAVLVYALVIAVLLAVALTRPVSERFDKKRTVVTLALFGIFFGPLTIFLRLVGLFPENGDPWLLPLIFVHNLLLVTGVIMIGILLSSMVADVVDENELETGRRQEGVFVSAITFTAKATSGIGSLIAGVALDVIEFPTAADPGTVPPGKVAALGLAVGPGLMALYLLAVVFLARYRITRERHREILAALAERGARAEAAAGR